MTEAFAAMLKRHEGWRLVPYRCPAGHVTIGCGHNVDANGLPDDMRAYLDAHGRVTEGMAERLLAADAEAAQSACRRLWPGFGAFSEARRDALTDFLFNVGEAKARTFRNTVADIGAGRWGSAAARLGKSRWRREVGGRADELISMIKEG